MPRPRPQSLALALVITNFVSQLRVPQSRHRVRRNKLSFPRSKPLPIPSEPTAPLPRSSARLVNQRPKHPLHVSFRSSQRLLQINFFPLLSRQRNQLPIRTHINSRNPPRFPIARLLQPRRSRIFRSFCGLLGLVRDRLHRIRALVFLLLFSARSIRKLLPRLSRTLRRILPRTLPRLIPLRPATAHHGQYANHAHHKANFAP